MKEAKPKPLAKLTEQQLRSIRGNDRQINSLGDALDRAYQRKQGFLERIGRTYGISELDFYVDLQTGEVFEEWPKA